MSQGRPSNHPSDADPTAAVPSPADHGYPSGTTPDQQQWQPQWAPQPPTGQYDAQPPGYPQTGYGQPGPYETGQYGQQPYGSPGYGAPPGYPPYGSASGQTNTMAILALVFAFVFSPLGIAFGFIARNQIRRTGEGGDSLALAGLILSMLFTLLAIAFVVFFFVVLLSTVGSVDFPSQVPR